MTAFSDLFGIVGASTLARALGVGDEHRAKSVILPKGNEVMGAAVVIYPLLFVIIAVFQAAGESVKPFLLSLYTVLWKNKEKLKKENAYHITYGTFSIFYFYEIMVHSMK